MDINSMFLAQTAITKFVNELRISTHFITLEKTLMEPVVEQLVSIYHGIPEVTYNPAEDTSGTDWLDLMLFGNDVKTRKFAYKVVMVRLQTLLADAAGIVTLDVHDKSRSMQDMSARDAFNEYRELGASVLQIVRLLNNLTTVIYPIITGYEEEDK